MLRNALLPFVFLAAACASTHESLDATDGDTSKVCFEAIKSLAGEWSGQGGDGDNQFDVEVSYRITAGGNTVEETLFKGTDHEMVTMYHLDGDKLMLTHYCVAGNQPRMVAERYSNDGTRRTIGFAYAGATNLASPDAGHMHAAELTIEGNDRIQTHWTYFQDGKPQHDARFDLKRTAAAKVSQFFFEHF